MNIYNKILSGLAVLGLASLLALAPAPASASGLIVNQIHYNDLIVVPYRSTLTVPPNTRYILSSTLVDDDGLQLPDDEQRGAGEATYTAGYYIHPDIFIVCHIHIRCKLKTNLRQCVRVQ